MCKKVIGRLPLLQILSLNAGNHPRIPWVRILGVLVDHSGKLPAAVKTHLVASFFFYSADSVLKKLLEFSFVSEI